MNSYISVPCKKPTEVSFKDPLCNYVKNNYNEAVLENVRSAFDNLDLLKTKAYSKITDTCDSSIEVLKEYHDTLLSLESRIPLDENNAIVQFKWHDAFSEKGMFSKNSLRSNCGAFERICILFDIGALHSQLAARQNLNDENGLKQATKSYQIAAGIFDQIRLVFPSIYQSDPTLDLKQDTLVLLSQIMIAQAQEMFYLKVDRDRLKAASLAKVSGQLHKFYQEAMTHANCYSLKGRLPREWNSILQYKTSYFEMIAMYQQAMACASDDSFGEQICRLKLALDKAKSLSKDYKEVKPFVEKLKNSLETADRDNRCIYHQAIPEAGSLAAIPCSTMAKPSPVTCPLIGSDFRDPFTALVPLIVQATLENANKICSEIVYEEIGRLRQATETLNGTITSLNLGSLSQEDGETVPRNILDASKIFRDKGGIAKLKELSSSLPESRQRNIEIVNSIRATIDEEENTDKNLRSQFGAKWTRKPSEQLNPTWRKEIEKYEGIFKNTTKTDWQTIERFETNSEFLEMLSLPEQELRNAVVSVKTDGPAPEGPKQLRDEIKTLVSKIDRMKADRQDLITQLQSIKPPDTLRVKYMEMFQETGNCADNDGNIARTAINANFEGPRACVRESLDTQSRLLNDLENKSNSYFGKTGSASDARSTLLTKLMLASESFLSLMDDFEQGLKFYADVTIVLMKLQQKVTDFVFARKTEKDELMSDINLDLSRAKIEDVPEMPKTTPPQRPPPPDLSQTQHQMPTAPQSMPTVHQPTPSQPAAYPVSGYPTMYPGYSPYPPNMPYPVPGMPYYGGTYNMPPLPMNYGYPMHQYPPPPGGQPGSGWPGAPPPST